MLLNVCVLACLYICVWMVHVYMCMDDNMFIQMRFQVIINKLKKLIHYST